MITDDELEPARRCRRCNGSGCVVILPVLEYYEDNHNADQLPLVMCPRCEGKGYVDTE